MGGLEQTLRTQLMDGDEIYSTNVPFGNRIWYFINGLLAVVPPAWVYFSIYHIDPQEMGWLYGGVSLVAAILMSLAYGNVWVWTKTRLLANREDVVTKSKVGKEAYDSVRKQQFTTTLSESSAFAILYNNLFFFAYMMMALYFLPNLPGEYNYGASVLSAAALVGFVSFAALKRKSAQFCSRVQGQ